MFGKDFLKEIEEKAKPIIEAIPIQDRTPEKEEQARKQAQRN